MIYKLETYNDKTYEITKAQFDFLNKNIDTMTAIKLNMATEMKGNIRDFYADYEASREREEEERSDIVALLGGGAVANFVDCGEIQNKDHHIKIKLKRIWFEHIKRRPFLNEKYKLGHNFTMQEHRIINTPIEELMDVFVSSLN